MDWLLLLVLIGICIMSWLTWSILGNLVNELKDMNRHQQTIITMLRARGF
jgi:hypothetical protein